MSLYVVVMCNCMSY